MSELSEAISKYEQAKRDYRDIKTLVDLALTRVTKCEMEVNRIECKESSK